MRDLRVDEEFREERQCRYRGRTYRVRDNGAVLREPRDTGRKASLDGKWTFGRKGQNGYLAIGGIPIHAIVACAYLGERPGKEYVVDHINTIRTDNRPSNLRYLTRLENILSNPLTCRKIERLTGMRIEDVLKDISVLRKIPQNRLWPWMGSVPRKEVEALLEKMEKITSKPAPSPEYFASVQGNLAVQADGWRPTGSFPFCPVRPDASLREYAANIREGQPFFRNSYHVYRARKWDVSPDGKTLAVQCVDPLAAKNFILVTVTHDIQHLFVHRCRRFFAKESLQKYYTEALGREWKGGPVFDDFC